MALKLFCSKCKEFMKEVTPDEAGRLGESTVCKECVNTAYTFKDELEKEYRKLNQLLANTHSKAIIKLEEIIHKALDE
jgi:hypothetical protein